MKHAALGCVAIAAALTGTVLAQAQEPVDESAEEQTTATEEEPAEAAPAAQGAAAQSPASKASEEAALPADTSRAGGDGPRFRFGVSGGAGFFTAKLESGLNKQSFTYGGTDLRFGVQVNDLLGVYAQPTLGYYSGGKSSVLEVGGLLGVAAGVDVTFVDRVFVGAGVGYTIYNNPAGISPLLRVGFYPVMSRSSEKIRRKGLMIGADLRITKLDGFKSIVMPTFNIGYEAF